MHRLPKNLRDALPNAAFIGFTGTPLMEGERTREFFGSYVSVYNFRQAIEDEATVPLYYEARVPELHLGPQDLTPELSQLVEDADLDEEQQRKVEREFKRQYHLITRAARLDTIAQDLVQHLLALKPGTKAMVVSVDKVTAGGMYQRVRAAWERHAATLRGKLGGLAADAPERKALEATLAYLAETDMALVVSQSQNEGEIFKRKGLDITPHRQRMMKEDLDTRFKDEKDPLRVVFVCAMWMTGFDVPSCGVIYLDKPLRNHTLMQTIARANRVFEDKQSGVIVDYIGVFQNLNQALEIYGSKSGGGVREGDRPLRPKEVLVQELAAALGDAQALCQKRGVNLDAAPQQPPLARVQWIQDSVNKLVHPEAERRELLALASRVDRLYGAVGLAPAKDGLAAPWGALMDVAGALRALEAPVDIAEFMAKVEGVLDEAVAAEPPVIYGQKRVHLGRIDFHALSQHFQRSPRKETVAAEVTAAATRRVRVLIDKNPLRKDLAAQIQELIDDYNAGAQSTGAFFERLLAFMRKLEEEAQRAEREGLTEESLALHDVLLSLPAIKLTEAEREQMKALARALPKRLAGKLVIDWRASQSGRAAVLSMIKDELDSGLPEAFGAEAYDRLCQAVFEHVYESYFGEGRSKYAAG